MKAQPPDSPTPAANGRFEVGDRSDAPGLASIEVRGTAVALALGRIAIGVGLMAAPARTLAALGFRRLSAEGVVVARIAGTRDLVLGMSQTLAMGDRDRLRRATLACAVTDAGDAFVFGAAMAGTKETRAAGLRGAAAAAPAALAGAWLAWRLR